MASSLALTFFCLNFLNISFAYHVSCCFFLIDFVAYCSTSFLWSFFYWCLCCCYPMSFYFLLSFCAFLIKELHISPYFVWIFCLVFMNYMSNSNFIISHYYYVLLCIEVHLWNDNNGVSSLNSLYIYYFFLHVFLFIMPSYSFFGVCASFGNCLCWCSIFLICKEEMLFKVLLSKSFVFFLLQYHVSFLCSFSFNFCFITIFLFFNVP